MNDVDIGKFCPFIRIFSPQPLLQAQAPLVKPLVVEKLGHVVPDGVREDHDALLAGFQVLGGLDRCVDCGTAAAT